MQLQRILGTFLSEFRCALNSMEINQNVVIIIYFGHIGRKKELRSHFKPIKSQ